jgi:hypothetical protein
MSRTRTSLMSAVAASTLIAAEDPRLLVRADGEEDGEEDAARKDEALKTMIADAVKDAMKPAMDATERCMDAAEKVMDRMDRMDARMDAMGSEETAEDKARKDAEEKEREDKARRDAMSAEEKEREDKARKDAEAAEAKEREDKARKDAEAKEREEHADADLVALRAQVADLHSRLGRQELITPVPLTDADSHALLDRQAMADEVFAQFGERAPPPQVNETLPTYRRRLLRRLDAYSDSLKETPWQTMPDGKALDELETRVYADAVAYAHSPASVPAGHLAPVVERTPAGHTITRYRGDASTWMRPMAGAVTSRVEQFLEQ